MIVVCSVDCCTNSLKFLFKVHADVLTHACSGESQMVLELLVLFTLQVLMLLFGAFTQGKAV